MAKLKLVWFKMALILHTFLLMLLPQTCLTVCLPIEGQTNFNMQFSDQTRRFICVYRQSSFPFAFPVSFSFNLCLISFYFLRV